jgi:ABC-type glutathione transport system ATPase component
VPQVLHEQLDMAQTTNNPTSSSSSSSHPSTPPTVIQIAHELSAILDYDSVVVMAAGKVVEQGNPAHLLQQEGSAFKNLVAQASHGLTGSSSWDSTDCLARAYSMNDV